MPTSKDLNDLDSQLKKSLISAENFKRGSSMDPSKSILSIHKTISTLAGHVRKLVIRVNDLEKNVNNQSKKITSLKNISKTQGERISGANIGAKLPGGTVDNVNESLKAIADSLSSIADILAGGKKLTDATAAFDRRKAEQEKRALAESRLEKSFEGLKKGAEKIIAPVKSILDRIIEFFVTVFFGRVVYKLLEWFGDPKNADKVRSIFRFLDKQWPKLLALYLTFGTALGGLSRTLVSVVVRGATLLGAAIFKLVGARKLSRFLGGRGGKVASAVIGTGVTLAGTYALTQGMKGSDEEPTQKLAGGGYVTPRFPAFSGGGFNFDFGSAMSNVMGGMKGMFGFGQSQETIGGYVSGEEGVDKVPAMLSDGEFVMSRGAVEKYGVDKLEAMNAAGGGTNKPKMVSGKAFAAGGGMIGGDGNKPTPKSQPLTGNYKLAYNIMKNNFPTAKPFHIAGALGNFDTEAPGLKPNTYQIGGGPGRGIAQWESPGRWDTATKKYGPAVINSLTQQLAYMKYEMDTGNPDSAGNPQLPYGRNTKSTWLNSKNLNDATLNFMNAYEAPGIPHVDRRLANAKKIMGSINTTTAPTSATKPKPKPQPNLFQQAGSSIMNLITGGGRSTAAAAHSGTQKLGTGGYAPQPSASAPAQLASATKPRNNITPLPRKGSTVSSLGGMNMGAGGGYSGSAGSGGSSIPSFSATAPGSDRSNKLRTLGIM